MQQLINNIKSGWHSGKGHKAIRQGKYEEALRHYQLTVQHESQNGKYGSRPNPVTLECIARTYARLGNYEESLITANKAEGLYKQLNSNKKLVTDCITRVDHLIELLNKGNTDDINRFLAI